MAKTNNNEWRSFHVRLSDSVSANDYKRIDALYRKLSERFAVLQADPRFVECVMSNIGEYRTNFVRAMAISYGKPYLSWSDVNNAAKYYRIMMTQAREVMTGLVKKITLAKVCESHFWKSEGNGIKEIQDDAAITLGYRPKYREIANLCQAKAIPTMPDGVRFELDYSSEDAQICEIVAQESDYVIYALKVDDGERVPLYINVPGNIREHLTHYARPNIIPVLDGEGDIVDYEVMVSYEPKVEESDSSGGILGVDLGKLKAVSMSALYGDGSVTEEYLATRETQNVLDKLNRVYDEVAATKKAVAACQDGGHLGILQAQLEGQRGKLSRLRESFARLVGRDVCACAVELGCGEVHLEDLARLIATGAQVTGRWNFAAVKKCVLEACVLRGIRVVLVDPAFTSQTSPFDNSSVLSGDDRLVDCGCCVLDRDYLAALNIARCERGKRVRSCGVVGFAANESVLRCCPVCCKLKSRKGCFK